MAEAEFVTVRSGDTPPAAVDRGWCLCLSGGGFRATLFHLGVVLRLNELGVLARLSRVTSVSGGSILNGVLATRWSRLTLGPDSAYTNLIEQVARPVRDFCSKDLRTPILLGTRLNPVNWGVLLRDWFSVSANFFADGYEGALPQPALRPAGARPRRPALHLLRHQRTHRSLLAFPRRPEGEDGRLLRRLLRRAARPGKRRGRGVVRVPARLQRLPAKAACGLRVLARRPVGRAAGRVCQAGRRASRPSGPADPAHRRRGVRQPRRRASVEAVQDLAGIGRRPAI